MHICNVSAAITGLQGLRDSGVDRIELLTEEVYGSGPFIVDRGKGQLFMANQMTSEVT